MCHAPEGDSKALEAGGLWQSGFLDSPAEGPAPLQFALNPPRASCILQTCAVIHVVIVTSKQGALWFDSKSPVQCPTLLLIRLQALFLPLQTGSTGFGKGTLGPAIIYGLALCSRKTRSTLSSCLFNWSKLCQFDRSCSLKVVTVFTRSGLSRKGLSVIGAYPLASARSRAVPGTYTRASPVCNRCRLPSRATVPDRVTSVSTAARSTPVSAS